jgi:two-component system chemotaxis response regulator CheY
MRTLIVEDDFTSRLLLQTFLSQYGDCHIAVNGVEAVEAFRAARESLQPYDLICMDIMMPDMDGQAALAAIRQIETAAGTPWDDRVKVIMTTALSDVRSVMTAFQGLCDEYLCKPIDTGALRDHLKTLRLVA